MVRYMRKYSVKGFISCKDVTVYGNKRMRQLFLTSGFFMG